jgi:hypothetical protein
VYAAFSYVRSLGKAVKKKENGGEKKENGQPSPL